MTQTDLCPYDVFSPFELITLILLFLLLFLYSFLYAATFLKTSQTLWSAKGICKQKNKCRVLLAIAHPDDEVMFFGPTILNLLHCGHSVYILCFSYGDSERLGWTRKEELWKSCKVLGVPDENIMIIKHDKLKDSQELKWPILPLSLHIKGFVTSFGIDTVITFDGKGVTGHLNHISVHNAVLDLVERNLLPSECQVFLLKSVGIIKQYLLNVFTIPLSYYFNLFVYVSKGGDYRRIVRAMKAHASQMVWFRRLHLLFSTYLFTNILLKIEPPSIVSK